MKTKEINLKFEDTTTITLKFIKETETDLKENHNISLPELKELILSNADNLSNINIISDDDFIPELLLFASFSKNFKYSLRNKNFYMIKTEDDAIFHSNKTRI